VLFSIDLQVVKLWIAHIDLADQMSNVEFVALITADIESASYRSMKEITSHAATFCADARFLAENVKNLALSADPRRCGNVDDFCSLYDSDVSGKLDIVDAFARLVNENKEAFNDSEYLVEFGTFEKWLNSNEPSEVHDKIAKLRQMTNTSYVAEKVTCAAEFGKFLSDTQEWLDTASMINESLPLQPADQTDALDQLIDNVEWLRESTYNYTVGRKTQVHQSNSVTGNTVQMIVDFGSVNTIAVNLCPASVTV
jgi:hypothetical protein